MTPKVSVLIPAYNAENTIKRAIDSIPDREDIEVIVYDDGSDDNTFDIACDAVARRKGVVTVEADGVNCGVAHAVNELLDMAKGEFVVLLGSDDWLITKNFNLVVDMLKPNLDLVYFNLEINDGSIFGLHEDTKYMYCGSTKFMRRAFVGDTRLDESKKAGEDWYFFGELQSKHPKEAFTNITAKHYNFPREGSLSWKQRHGEFGEGEV